MDIHEEEEPAPGSASVDTNVPQTVDALGEVQQAVGPLAQVGASGGERREE